MDGGDSRVTGMVLFNVLPTYIAELGVSELPVTAVAAESLTAGSSRAPPAVKLDCLTCSLNGTFGQWTKVQ